MMSDTPRTDAERFCADSSEWLTTARFSGQLERENAALLEALKALVERIDANGGLGEYKGGPAFVMQKAREALALTARAKP